MAALCLTLEAVDAAAPGILQQLVRLLNVFRFLAVEALVSEIFEKLNILGEVLLCNFVLGPAENARHLPQAPCC